MRLKNLLVLFILSSSLLGCFNFRKDVQEEMKELDKGPDLAPTKSLTNFSDALRCMDNMMLEYGIRDVSALVEDLQDKTTKINAGTRDMLISAVSDMTRRSRAIQLIAYGTDSGNLLGYLSNAGRKSVYAQIPSFDIRGSISQFDKDIVTKQADVGFGVEEFGIGAAMHAQGSVLGLDMSIINTENLAVIPGVVSRNTIAIVGTGKGVDSDGLIEKAGINFSFNLSKSDGNTQALRNLIELAMVELFGRLLKVPYWKCIGIDTNHANVKEEVADWYYAMKVNNELIPYLKKQMRNRGYYTGVVDNAADENYLAAVTKYKENQALGTGNEVDESFVSAFWNKPYERLKLVQSESEQLVPNKAQGGSVDSADPQTKPESTNTSTETVAVKNTQSPQKKPSPGNEKVSSKTQAPQKVEKIAKRKTGENAEVLTDVIMESSGIAIRTGSNTKKFKPGEQLELVIKPEKDGYLYCFYSDDADNVIRIFPNRYQMENYIGANTEVKLPGKMPFELTASKKGVTESIGCFTTNNDIFAYLPDSIRIVDFVKLNVLTIEEIRDGFMNVVGNNLGEGYFAIKTK
jgi:hypothetical protein